MYANNKKEPLSPATVKTEWQLATTNPMERLQQLYETRDGSDVIFQARDSENKLAIFKAHKIILTMTSSYFEALFQQDTVVKLGRVDCKAFEQLLRYIYLNDITLPNIHTAINTAWMAVTFRMWDLAERCNAILSASITKENAFILLEAGCMKLGHLDLKYKCKYFMNTPETLGYYVNLTNIHRISEETLRFFLDNFCYLTLLDTKEIFSALLGWSKAHCTDQNNPAEVRKVFEQFLPRLNILNMTSKDFLQTVVTSCILSQQEVVEISVNLERPPGQSLDVLGQLPSWCNRCYQNSSSVLYSSHNGRGFDVKPMTWNTTFKMSGKKSLLTFFCVEGSSPVALHCEVQVNGIAQVSSYRLLGTYQCMYFYPEPPISLDASLNVVMINFTLPEDLDIPPGTLICTWNYQSLRRQRSQRNGRNLPSIAQEKLSISSGPSIISKMGFLVDGRYYLND